MKKWISGFLVALFVSSALLSCNTNKPADEVKGAQERVKKKVEQEHQNQNAEDPGE